MSDNILNQLTSFDNENYKNLALFLKWRYLIIIKKIIVTKITRSSFARTKLNSINNIKLILPKNTEYIKNNIVHHWD